MPLIEHLNAKHPLGPVDSVLVESAEDASELLAGAAPFLEAISQHAALILGRKGSGKSSVLHGHRSTALFGKAYGPVLKQQEEAKRDYILPFDSLSEFDVMLERVGREINDRLRLNPDVSFLTIEGTARIWNDLIWEYILRKFYSIYIDESTLESTPPAELDTVSDYFENRALITSNLVEETVKELFAEAKKGVLSYLQNQDSVCKVIFDNVEKYPIRSPYFENAISGLVRATQQINENDSGIDVVVCIPEEIQSFMVKYSDNTEKDFFNSYRLRWNPIDLLQIVCHRFRLFISTTDDKEFYESIIKYDFKRRNDVITLMRRILPENVENRLGYKEDTIGFITRHTQLRPRHYILIFTEIIIRAHEASGGYRNIEPKALLDGVEKAEIEIARQVLNPYNLIYPKLVKACKPVLSNMPPICDASHLRKFGSRFKGRIEPDIDDVWETLYEMGVIGIIDPQNYKLTPNEAMYVRANFIFNSEEQFSLNDARKYCLHPIFSKFFGTNRELGECQIAVYPDRVEDIWAHD